MAGHEDVFIGRQPIVDRERRVAAFELLFRASADATCAEIGHPLEASARVIANTFASVGVEAVLGPYAGFINATTAMLLSGMVEALPPSKVVLEILEDVPGTPEILECCRALRRFGFRLALDDFTPTDPRRPLLEVADFVKIDVLDVRGRPLQQLVRALRGWPVCLVAEKVETPAQLARCRELGFELFQGYHLAPPVVLSRQAQDVARDVYRRLVAQAQGGAAVPRA